MSEYTGIAFSARRGSGRDAAVKYVLQKYHHLFVKKLGFTDLLQQEWVQTTGLQPPIDAQSNEHHQRFMLSYQDQQLQMDPERYARAFTEAFSKQREMNKSGLIICGDMNRKADLVVAQKLGLLPVRIVCSGQTRRILGLIENIDVDRHPSQCELGDGMFQVQIVNEGNAEFFKNLDKLVTKYFGVDISHENRRQRGSDSRSGKGAPA